jgi:hypothetical protein
VVVDVAVVEDVLLDAAQRGELGQHRGGEPELVHQLEPAGARGATIRLSSANTRSAATRASPARCAAHRRAVSGSIVEVELDREPRRAQRPQRVVGERAGADHPQPPRREVGAAAVRVEQLAARQRLGHRVDREVARGEVGGEVAVAQRTRSTCQAWPRADDAPGPERAGERERVRAPRGATRRRRRAASPATRGRGRVVAAEQPVAHRAADDPRPAGPQAPLATRSTRLARCAWCRAARAAEIPQVTS